jgi:hypothetical protein
MPTSLPRPPTTWTKKNSEQKFSGNAKLTLSFEDLVYSHQTDLDPLSQQLKLLLKVQA